ncbi:DUF362 domain-containing protein [Trichocoleus desertorum AS-A10]|uniref:DUF362 domain-containing protein n=1 Tax=Trichocoleus desertorum TaxID=1481672 RepID=UPI00329A3582
MTTLSIIADPNLDYPQESGFSPSERFPEYRYAEIACQPNLVYGAVRSCFAQAGLDEAHFGSPTWNPLGEFIQPGQRVFVLCNFVFHRRLNESAAQFKAKCTQGAMLRALVDYLLIAVGSAGKICFGNAPVQSCQWESVLEETGAQQVLDFYQAVGARVTAQDLRLYVAERTPFGSIRKLEQRQDDNAVSIDLGEQSLLTQISQSATTRFRLSDYDPRRTEAFHANGSHVYVLNQQVLAADVIVSLPKLKTHEKVGITCALKGCVGAIAHKDCLAHHRFGPPTTGGDEYPSDRFYIKRAASKVHDWVQQTPANGVQGNSLRVIDRLLRSGLRRLSPTTAGAWWGNDTAWRMALDIARILRYADAKGVLQPAPVRPHLVLIDGVIGGEGTGPLKPTPVKSGIVLFSDEPVLADAVSAQLMGFAPEKIPLLQATLTLQNYPLTCGDWDKVMCSYNGQAQEVGALTPPSNRGYQPPPGWCGYIERA